MSKNKGVIIFLILLVILLFYNQGGKKEANIQDDYQFYSVSDLPIDCHPIFNYECTQGTMVAISEKSCKLPKWSGFIEQMYSWQCSGGGGTSTGHISSIKGTELNIVLASISRIKSTIISDDSFKDRNFKSGIVLEQDSLSFYIGDTFLYSISTIEGNTQSGSFSISPLVSDSNIIDIEWQGELVNRVNISNINGNLKIIKSGNGKATIKIPRTKIPLSCNVENDEQPIQDPIMGPAIVNINSLAYKPVKFCIGAYPQVLRDFTTQQLGPVPEYTFDLASGKNIYIKENQEVTFQYIVDYREEMGPRCRFGQAYSPVKKACVQTITESPDTIEIINRREVVTVSKNQVFFENQAIIGAEKITSTGVSYNCNQSASPPQPRADCWTTQVKAFNKTLNFIDKETKKINNYMSLQFIADGFYNGEFIKDGHAYFLLTIDDFSFIEMTPQYRTNYYLNLNQQGTMDFIINNKLTSFSSTQAGYISRETTDLVVIDTTKYEYKSLPLGTTSISIPVSSSIYGIITKRVSPFFRVNNEIIADDDVLTYNFNILQDTPEQVERLKQNLSDLILTEQQLRANINTKISLIQNLTKIAEEQGIILEKYKLTIEEDANAILSLQQNIVEQAKILSQLNNSIQQNILTMESMQKTISEQLVMINILSKTQDEKDQYIAQLLSNIASQESKIIELNNIIKINTDIIGKMDATVDEQIKIIEALTINVNEKNRMIIELTNKISEQDRKIQLMLEVVNSLETNYQNAKSTILLLESQLKDSQDKVNFLILTIDELQLNNNQTKDLLENIGNTVEEDKDLINSLQLSNQELLELVSFYKGQLDKETEIVRQLNLNNSQLTQLINMYESRLMEQQTITKNLNISNQELNKLISDYKNGLITQETLINQLNIENLELNKLVMEYDERLRQKAEYISMLELSLEKEKELVVKLSTTIEEQKELLSKTQELLIPSQQWYKNMFVWVGILIGIVLLKKMFK